MHGLCELSSQHAALQTDVIRLQGMIEAANNENQLLEMDLGFLEQNIACQNAVLASKTTTINNLHQQAASKGSTV
ncbi:hypothetical protein Hanom_Chr00s003710g01715341 [Helianthus anomalus]